MVRFLFFLVWMVTVSAGCLPRWPCTGLCEVENSNMVESLNDGDLEGAETHCSLALEASPDNPMILTNCGLIQLKRGQVPKARVYFQLALRSDQEFAQAYNNLGIIALEYDHQPGRAADFFRRALAVNPQFPGARLNLAMALEQQKDVEGARREYRKLAVVAPEAAEPHFHLARLDALERHWAEAEKNLRRATDLRPDFDPAWCLLVVVMKEQGRAEEAREAQGNCGQKQPIH